MHPPQTASALSLPEATVASQGFALESEDKPDDIGITPEERAARIDLAAAYRLCALFGWDDLIYTHISARIPGQTGRFLGRSE